MAVKITCLFFLFFISFVYTQNITILRTLPEESFYKIHKIAICNTDKNDILERSVKLKQVLSIKKEDFVQSGNHLIEIVVDKHSSSETYSSWSREGWIKNGLLHIVSSKTPCRASVHSLSSLIGTASLFIISDQISWNEGTWSLPEFFQVSESYGFGKDKTNIVVYDITTSCAMEEWHKYPKVILKEVYCPKLLELNNFMWIPAGWRNAAQIWNIDSLVPAIYRYYFFYISKSLNPWFTRILNTVKDSKIMDRVRGKIEYKNEDLKSWKTHLLLRDSVFSLCAPDNVADTCIFDALAHGTIPIVYATESLEKEFEILLGPLPFPVVRNYDDMINIISYCLDNLEEIITLQNNTIKWWDQKLYRIQSNLIRAWFS